MTLQGRFCFRASAFPLHRAALPLRVVRPSPLIDPTFRAYSPRKNEAVLRPVTANTARAEKLVQYYIH